MPPKIMFNTVEVSIEAERDGNKRVNVIHFRHPGTVTAADLDGLLNHVENGINSILSNIPCTGTVFRKIVATVMDTATGLRRSRSIVVAGGGGTDVLPANCALCLTKNTDQRGRSFQGGVFPFDLSEDAFNGSTVNPLWLPQFTNAAAWFQTEPAGSIFLAAVGSPKLQGSTQITSMTFDLVADSQRRRLPGRGD